ncbi:U32 family peptidase [Clostridium sp. DL1XJH146]
MRKIELLAPAGSIASLVAAVQNGADAVYLGGQEFSARAYASNFDNETMAKVVDYCHLYSVKVYVTVNTLIKDDEIERAIKYIDYLYKTGVDALIIQDIGLAKKVTNLFPDFEIHASTQMTVHNLEGAKFLKEFGFERIVLARELSLEEIKDISLKNGIETEVFVHGALCICYSGQCLMSSIIGGRSGNRGRCAQPCRLPYELVSNEEDNIKKGYLLSPKDICTIESIPELIRTGTSSLKIEGRMKRPEYVAGVVRAYRKAIDAYYNGEKFDVEKETKILAQLFNREGFSKGYLNGKNNSDLMALDFPKNTGVYLGRIEESLEIILKEDISLQDGVRIEDGGFIVTKIIMNNKEVTEAQKGQKVKLFPQKYFRGDKLYKTLDVNLMKELEETFKDKYGEKLNLNISIEFIAGKRVKLWAKYKGRLYEELGEEVQTPINRPLDKERIIKSLKKTGDTPFLINEIDFKVFGDGFIPISTLNNVRRSLINRIMVSEIKSYKRNKDTNIGSNSEKALYSKENTQVNTVETDMIEINPFDIKSSHVNGVIKNDTELKDELFVYVLSEEAFRAAIDSKVSNIIVDPFKRGFSYDFSKKVDASIFMKVPNIIKEEYDSICSYIDENLANIDGIVTGNLGIIDQYKNITKIYGDYKLNVFNKDTAEFWNQYLEGFIPSIELNKKEIKEIGKEKAVCLIYGKYEVMVTEYCPVGYKSCKGTKAKNNTVCSNGDYYLKDRKDNKFLILNDKYCRSHIYNPITTSLLDNTRELQKLGFNKFRIDFIDENYEECMAVLNYFKNEKKDKLEGNYTRGHYKRGVE